MKRAAGVAVAVLMLVAVGCGEIGQAEGPGYEPTAQVRTATKYITLKVLQDAAMVKATESAVATDKAACLHGSRVPPGSVTGQCDDLKTDSGFVIFNKAVLNQDEQELRFDENELKRATLTGVPVTLG
jgi:hypothetical protein